MSAEQELINKIIEKAWSDPEFKEKLLSDPKSAIVDSFNVTVPDDIELHVVEETATDFYLVLPQEPADPSDDQDAMW